SSIPKRGRLSASNCTSSPEKPSAASRPTSPPAPWDLTATPSMGFTPPGKSPASAAAGPTATTRWKEPSSAAACSPDAPPAEQPPTHSDPAPPRRDRRPCVGQLRPKALCCKPVRGLLVWVEHSHGYSHIADPQVPKRKLPRRRTPFRVRGCRALLRGRRRSPAGGAPTPDGPAPRSA